MNIISMCLYGDDPLYVQGVMENLRLMPEVYPGWVLRIYSDQDIQIHGPMLEAFKMPAHYGHVGMFWRFLAASDPDADAVVFRDADSRLSLREKAAVDAWIESGKRFHVMRDHPDHASWPMLGGMWGFRGAKFKPLQGPMKNMAAAMHSWLDGGAIKEPQKLDDMRFLRDVVWPLASTDMKHHSSVETVYPGAEGFPSDLVDGDHVGRIVQV